LLKFEIEKEGVVLMKRVLTTLGLLIIADIFAVAGCGRTAIAVGAIPAPPAQQAIVDISIFYDELAPYGDWFEVEEYGWVWTPSGVPVGWRPYTNGYWVFTDYGWTWVSHWRWGWAPFHYGRWVFHPRHGWVWIPGRVWGPAWVVWRHSPGWVGWAPMPPQRGWRVGIGFTLIGDAEGLIEPHWYSFVAERHLAERNLSRHFELAARNVTLVHSTRNVTNYQTVENRIVDRSIDVRQIEQATGRRIIERRVADGRPGVSEGRGNNVPFYRPNIGRDTTDRAPRRVTPPRPPLIPDAEQARREAQERDQLRREQERERRRLDELHRQEQARRAAQMERERIQRRQEAERRAQDDQRRREQEILRNRQEMRRQTERPRPEGASI
jgi:uncharacterized protein DUF6600